MQPIPDKTMFREYDIRGIVSQSQLNADSVKLIARGISSYLQKHGIKKMLVGMDSRESSPLFHEIVVREFLKSGAEVIDIGMVLVPMFYFAQYQYKCKGGVYISASHNPSNWNGFKVADNYSSTILGSQMNDLYRIITNKDFVYGKGSYQKQDIINKYAQNILKTKIVNPLKIVIDAGNATAGPIVPAIFEKAGHKVIKLYCDLDSSFPNHEPNPSAPENKKVLAETVLKNKADIGLSFDTDGDRLGVVDDKGNIIEADQFFILLSRQVLKQYPGEKIIFDVKCTQSLPDDIIKSGGKPVMWKTGHSYIKAKMKEENSPLGGEVSGHIFYRDNYGFDDAVFAAYKLTAFIGEQKKHLSQLMKSVPKYISTPTLNAMCDDKIKYKIVEKLTKEFKKKYKVIDINGARVIINDGWGLVRASSNLPALVLRFEARTEKSLHFIMDIFKTYMNKYPEIKKGWTNG